MSSVTPQKQQRPWAPSVCRECKRAEPHDPASPVHLTGVPSSSYLLPRPEQQQQSAESTGRFRWRWHRVHRRHAGQRWRWWRQCGDRFSFVHQLRRLHGWQRRNEWRRQRQGIHARTVAPDGGRQGVRRLFNDLSGFSRPPSVAENPSSLSSSFASSFLKTMYYCWLSQYTTSSISLSEWIYCRIPPPPHWQYIYLFQLEISPFIPKILVIGKVFSSCFLKLV